MALTRLVVLAFLLVPFLASAQNFISTVAGNGIADFSGDDGPATAASLYLPSDVAVDPSGNVYIADTANHRIRKVGPDGTITTVAGTGTPGGRFNPLEDGPAITALLNSPSGVAVDASENLYIADSENYRIRKVTPDGIISTVAGNAIIGTTGDGGPADQASIGFVSGLAVDADGNLYIADQSHSKIRKVTPDGLIRNFHFELPLHPKTYASYPVVSIANRPGLFEVVVRHILAVLRSRCAGFACPACLAADTCPARPLLST